MSLSWKKTRYTRSIPNFLRFVNCFYYLTQSVSKGNATFALDNFRLQKSEKSVGLKIYGNRVLA
jgi:hypothetical protein